MKIKLVEDWKDARRWFSVNCMALGMAIQGAWVCIPEDMRKAMPDNLVAIITTVVLLLGVMGRLVKQEKKRGRAS